MTGRVGELLVRKGLVTREQLQRALQSQRQAGGSLLANLVELGAGPDERLAAVVAEALDVPFVRADALDALPPDVVAHVTRDMAERHRVMPFRLDGIELQVCVADPDRIEELEDLRLSLGRPVRAVLVTDAALNDALERYYGVRPELRLSRAPDPVPPVPTRERAQLSQQIVRTGIFQVPAPIVQAAPPVAQAPPPPDPVEQLAAVMNNEDVLRATFAFFAGLFEEVALLGVHKGQAVVLMVGSRAGLRTLPARVEVPLVEGSLLWSVLARPQVAHRTRVEDQTFLGMCWAMKLPPTDVCIIPVFDNGRPAFLAVGQGRDDQYIKQRFHEVKTFLGKVSQAMRIVAIRRDIRGAAAAAAQPTTAARS